MINIVIADDHSIVRQGITALLERSTDIKVVGEAEDGLKAIEMVERLQPDILIIDISMPRLNGLQAVERIHALQLPTRVIVLSMHADELTVRQAFKVGAQGYLVKRSETEDILLAVRAVHRGELYISSAVSQIFLSDFMNSQEVTLFDRLSPREREVLQLIAEGHTGSEIADMMIISPRTVEKHRASLMEKLGIHDLAGLIRIAIKHGLISLDD
ncbi:MAG: response regulator transcription factor [Anaerolineae bacterium]|nr:response regulator transcription factor [Anaerolineae bacterium]MBN8618562.1 response regulator transcription factor [Anaerolineae bacterium]